MMKDLTARQMERYLEDPLLRQMYDQIRSVGPLRSVQIDITHKCNIRCKGCYFFEEDLDRFKAPTEESDFDSFVEREKARGTNYVLVVGGEPSLMLGRLKKLYDSFWLMVVTNGIKPIPREGFENLAIAVSVWGDHETDTDLRGRGKLDVFARALANYKDDPRVVWYYTTTPGNVHEIESVVDQCVANGNLVGFNFYGDISHLGGGLDHRLGFGPVCDEIDRMIDRYPDRIMLSSYIARVIAERKLYDDEWGHDVCCTLSGDRPENLERFKNGKPSNAHFRVYNPDLQTTRGCCRSSLYDCENCFDAYAHFSWIILNLEKHLGSKGEFTNWLSTMFIFYLSSRLVDVERGTALLPEIHRRLAEARQRAGSSGERTITAEIEELVYEAL